MSANTFRPWLVGGALLVAAGAACDAHAAATATVGSTTTTPLLTKSIDKSQMTTLQGSVPAVATA
jgi:hypothetical protein